MDKLPSSSGFSQISVHHPNSNCAPPPMSQFSRASPARRLHNHGLGDLCHKSWSLQLQIFKFHVNFPTVWYLFRYSNLWHLTCYQYKNSVETPQHFSKLPVLVFIICSADIDSGVHSDTLPEIANTNPPCHTRCNNLHQGSIAFLYAINPPDNPADWTV